MVGMVSSAGTVYGIIKGESDMRSVSISVCDNLPPVIVVLGITRVTEKLADMAVMAGIQLHRNKMIVVGEKILLLRELDRLERLKLTAMTFFPLDKEFLLNYFGSVLTYAALIAGFTQPQTGCDAMQTGMNLSNETAANETLVD